MPLSRNCWSVMAAAAATRLRALTWLVPVKITPFWFTTSTVPSALIAPWISLGFADAPTTRFSAASDAFCLNCSVVLRPTLKLSQFRMARDCVCSMVTTWRPSAALFCGAPGAFPFGLRALGRSTGRPASVRPTRRRRWRPPPRARGGAACCAATAAAVRFRLSSERCNCWRDCACCWLALPTPARLPSGRRPERCTADCAAPLSANQPGLKAAIAPAPRPPRRRRSAARPPPGRLACAARREGRRKDGRKALETWAWRRSGMSMRGVGGCRGRLTHLVERRAGTRHNNPHEIL